MEFALHSSAPVTAPSEDRQFAITLLQDLEYLHRTAKALELPIYDLDNALIQVKNQALSVVVVGEFKRGKSTFINALLGQNILPSDILPTTATINRVVFGSTPSATVRFKDGRDQSIAIEQLESYVTKLTSDAEAISSRVQEAVIHYPLHYCRNGVEIIDTPGLSDEEAMTEVTLSVLCRTEIVIMVTSAISPFAESEGVFLTEVLLEQGINHILFVVNGIDYLKESEDIDRILQNITQRIRTHICDWANRKFGEGSQEYNSYIKRMGVPRVYGLSSQQALEAKRTGKKSLLERSRFQEFEASLNCLLTEERQRISFQMSVETAISKANQILKTIETQKYAMQVQQQSTKQKISSIVEDLSILRVENRKELNHIDRGITNIESEITTILYSLDYRLEQTAEQTIDNTVVDMSSNLNEITSYFADQVASTLRSVISSIESDITEIVSREAEKQQLKLETLSSYIDQQVSQIQNQCLQIKINFTTQDSVYQFCDTRHQDSLKPISNILAIASNQFYVQEQAKGGYTVAGAVIGSFFGGFGAPVGAALGASLGEQRRKKMFKQFYRSEVLSIIKTTLDLQAVNQKINQYVVAATGSLRTSAYKVRQQSEAILDSIEQEVFTFQGEQEAKSMAEQKQLDQLMPEILKIIDNSYLLLNHLGYQL